MAVQIYWQDEPQHILRFDYHGTWSWEEHAAAQQTALAYMAAAPHEVCLLHDMRFSTQFPEDGMRKIRKMMVRLPSNTGCVVFITQDGFIIKLLLTLMQLYPGWSAHYIIQPTEAAALAYMAHWMALRYPAAP